MRTLYLLLPVVSGLLTACSKNYQSVLHAEQACEHWASQGIEVALEPSEYLESIDYKGSTTNRFCEKKEIQYIGYIFDLPVNEQPVVADELMKLRGNAKPTKKFRW